MKSFILCIFISVALICEIPAQMTTVSFQSSGGSSKNTNPQPITVLFIGNSHTYTNDIPAIISRMTNSNGDSVYTFMSAPGGFNLKDHSVYNATIPACTIYATIFNKKITGTYYPPAIPEETAYSIQNTVSEVLLDNNIDWRSF